MSEFKLCYIDEPWAHFTTQALDKQWGDDWGDAPYECNAGRPYGGEWELCKVAFEVDGETPRDAIGRHISVRDINGKLRPWLRLYWNEPGQDSTTMTCRDLYAGTTLEEFKAAVRAAGGTVFVEEELK